MTDKEFCRIYSAYYGEKLDHIEQLKQDIHTGEELKDLIEFFIEKTMSKKQTAVDWLFQQLWDIPKDKLRWHSIFETAKEMEKEQMEEAVSNGISNADMTNNRGYFDFDKWFNETYGGNH